MLWLLFSKLIVNFFTIVYEKVYNLKPPCLLLLFNSVSKHIYKVVIAYGIELLGVELKYVDSNPVRPIFVNKTMEQNYELFQNRLQKSL